MLEQTMVGIFVVAFSLAVLISFVRKFSKNFHLLLLATMPLMIFVLGYSMRLTGGKNVIDMGYFFTDLSFLFVYLLFAISFILGQLKYWKIK